MFGGLTWVDSDPELDAAVAQHLGRADTVLMGRRTYELLDLLCRARDLDDRGRAER